MSTMTTKKGAPIAARHVIRWTWNVVVLLSVALCLFALFTLHSQYSPPDISSSSSSSFSSRQRARISRDNFFQGSPKIAFLFLARRNLPLDFLWDTFFEVFHFFFFFSNSEWIFCSLINVFFGGEMVWLLWKFGRMVTWRTSRSIFTRLRGSSSMG
jgi:hypothetical protein